MYDPRRLASRKFWLTVYSVILLPLLLHLGYIDGQHFVALYPMTLGLYFGGNVWQRHVEKDTKGSNYNVSDTENS